MHVISIVLGIFAIWRGARGAPRGTIFATGVLLSVIGWAIDRGPLWPIQSISADMKIVGFVAVCVGAVELAWMGVQALRERRRRRAYFANLSTDELLGSIYKRMEEHAGQEITFEVVKESQPPKRK